MAAYVIADIEVIDSAGFAEYQQKVPATIAAYGGRYLVRGGAAEVLEGNGSPKRCVVLEFPNMAQFKSWYASPEYLPLIAIRERTAKSNLLVIEGIQQPGQ
jgi:uncharacterized protein (DUF1330 family)